MTIITSVYLKVPGEAGFVPLKAPWEEGRPADQWRERRLGGLSGESGHCNPGEWLGCPKTSVWYPCVGKLTLVDVYT